ncbi:MAG: hypothetical protein HRT89_03025 [Lentisphaeria bacterium]|nr:hypothetical protein [Lentisphaeria bacterium]NQZ67022.1 hypothetical protein [Lentisphaeria bacterium]
MGNFEFISKIFIRENHALDIGAYDYGYKHCLNEGFSGRVMFINSSVSGPHSDGWLDKYEELFLSHSQIGLSGTTTNTSPAKDAGVSTQEHVQSWLLYSDMSILKDCFGDSLLSNASYKTKLDVIENGEIYISQKILNKGYGINCMAFPKLHFFKGDSWPYPFKFRWRGRDKSLQQFINTTIV